MTKNPTSPKISQNSANQVPALEETSVMSISRYPWRLLQSEKQNKYPVGQPELGASPLVFLFLIVQWAPGSEGIHVNHLKLFSVNITKNRRGTREWLRRLWGSSSLDLALAYKWLGRRLVSNRRGCFHPYSFAESVKVWELF